MSLASSVAEGTKHMVSYNVTEYRVQASYPLAREKEKKGKEWIKADSRERRVTCKGQSPPQINQAVTIWESEGIPEDHTSCFVLYGSNVMINSTDAEAVEECCLLASSSGLALPQ